jgi:hypothetical protein
VCVLGQPAGAGCGRAGGAAAGVGGWLLEQEELDDITLRRELKVLSTHETTLERREANLDWERKALEDTQA